MLGSLLKIVTRPIDAVGAGVDALMGGDGSDHITGDIEDLRDEFADVLDDLL